MNAAHMNPDDIPPSDQDAERAVLGGVLREPESLHEIHWLKPDHFYHDSHQTIFRAVLDLHSANRPVDLVTVIDVLTRNKVLENVGGRDYVVDLWGFYPPGGKTAYHATLVKDAAVIRQLIHAASEILRECYDRPGSAEELVANAEKRILAIADHSDPVKEPQVAAKFMQEALTAIDDRIAGGGKFSGIPTGYADVDDMLGGIENGEVIIVGARPSVGKTAFTVNVLSRIAGEGLPVLFFSAEQPIKAIAQRMLAMGSGVPMHRFTRSTRLSDDDLTRLNRAASKDEMGGCPIYVDDTPGPSVSHIGHVLRRAIRKHNIAVAAVDYLQLLSPDDRRAPKHVQVGDMSTRLKWLARECNIPIFVLSQLSRSVEERGGRPRLADLRESGSIEQDADRVLFLHREAGLPTEDPDWPIDVIVSKNRNGPIGDTKLLYVRAVMRFENMAQGNC